MNSFDDLRKRDQENATQKSVEEKAYKQKMDFGQRMYDGIVYKCLRELGEYWFGSIVFLIFSQEHYKIENAKPGEWALRRKPPSGHYEDDYLLVKYVGDSDSKGYFSFIRMVAFTRGSQNYVPEVKDRTKGTSEDELRQLLVSIGEKWSKPTTSEYPDSGD